MPARAAPRLDRGEPERRPEVVAPERPVIRACGFRSSEFGFPRRDRVFATATPGMAAADSVDRQAPAAQRAVRLERAQRVIGAAWREAALRQRPKQEGFRRGNHPAIEAHAKN